MPPDENTTETTSVSEGESAHVTLMFWLSVAVLVLLLWISIRTVMSVVGPVRRMRVATQRLAKGGARVRVRRGGIRELDDLAVSFNEMAEQLSRRTADHGTRLPGGVGGNGEPAHAGTPASGGA